MGTTSFLIQPQNSSHTPVLLGPYGQVQSSRSSQSASPEADTVNISAAATAALTATQSTTDTSLTSSSASTSSSAQTAKAAYSIALEQAMAKSLVASMKA